MAEQDRTDQADGDDVVDAEVVPDEAATDDGESRLQPAPPAPAPGTALEIHKGSTALIEATTPQAKVEQATAIATALDDVIKRQGMRTKIGRRKRVQPDGTEVWEDRFHVDVEGWQTLATFLDVVTHVAWSRRVRDEQTGELELAEYPVERFIYPRGTKKAAIKNGSADVEALEVAMVTGYSWEAKVVAVRNGVVVGEAEAMCSRTEEAWRDRDDFALRSMAQTRATGRAIAAAARWIVTLAGYAGTPAEEMGPAAAEGAAEQPAYGPPVDGDSLKRIRKAIAYALELDDPMAVEVANVLQPIEQAFGYFPTPAGRGLYELGIAVYRQRNPNGHGRAEAEQAQAAAESPSDIPAPDTTDLPPAEQAVGPDDPSIKF